MLLSNLKNKIPPTLENGQGRPCPFFYTRENFSERPDFGVQGLHYAFILNVTTKNALP
jgi:hypothetical protein